MSPNRALPLFAVLLLATRPDEGQWLPQQLRSMDWKRLEERGMKLTPDEFWHPERGGVLSAAVQISGCTASFVSPDGLVLTNHHCGFGAIEAVSTTARNHLRDGFTAASRAEEIPAPGMQVLVVRRIEDVTKQVHAAAEKANSDLQRYDMVQAEIARLIAQGQHEPDTVCHVASFFEGREYHLYHRTRLSDVRLVYAPPRSVGEYGGDIDNWEWPRHTGDFAFFRAYVAPDGSARAHHPENVPYRPRHWLQISPDGVHEGDLVLIMGYPGRTERYLTADAVQARESHYWPTRRDLYARIIEILQRVAESDPEKALRLSTRIKSLANVEKAARGQIHGLRHNATVERKMREESEFERWVAADPEREKRFGGVLDEMRALDAAARETEGKDLILTELLRQAPLVRTLTDLVTVAMQLRGQEDPKWPQPLEAQLASETLTLDVERIEKPVLGVFLEEMRLRPAADHLLGTDALTDLRTGLDEMLEWLFAQTRMLTRQDRQALLAAGPAAVLDSTDPLLVLARGLAIERSRMVARQREQAGRRLVVGARWIAAQQEWRGHSFYPDANSTLRVAIASVKGYSPRDGMRAYPHTTVAGMVEKYTSTEPFDLPEPLLSQRERRRNSRFVDPVAGDVPVCFLADGDTTGGNSGSPVIDGRGRLVGVNFDRVFEAVAGDYGWSPELSRNICVDLRFVLWFVTEVQPADALVKELGI